VTDLPGADDDELATTEDRLAADVAGEDARERGGGGAPAGDSAISLADGAALAPPD
jgi:hypothetical protein